MLTVSKLTDAYSELHIHLSEDYDVVTARNVLMIHVMKSNDFYPASNPAYLDYLWDLWYSLQWTDDTKKRFLKDIKQLLDSQSCGVEISNPKGIGI